MIRRGYTAGDTLEEVFNNLHINYEDGMKIVQPLFDEGYTRRGVCYAVGKSLYKLLKFRDDSRFIGVFKNEVRKYATNWKELMK